MKTLLNTREVAELLDVNEKMVYSLVSEKGLPATKVTGKWLFPRHLVERWIETHTINAPETATRLPPYHGLLIIAGSNDLLLDKTIAHFNATHGGHVGVFGNLGSLGGLRALKHNFCHIATSHLLEKNEKDYNFGFASEELGQTPVVVNFCLREQGLIVSKEKEKVIRSVEDLRTPGIRIANRPLGTGTRLLFDKTLKEAGIKGENINGYQKEIHRHMDVGLEILSGRADAAPGIKPVASLLGLGFIPIRQERYDLLVMRDRFFEKGIQLFLGILHENPFKKMADELEGYDTSLSGKMVFPKD